MDQLIRKTTAQQVAEAVELAILTGEFEQGSRLPTERRLAGTLGVCRATLREGLNRLEGRGLIVAIPGLGLFVTSAELKGSVEHLAPQYLLEKVPQRKVELVRYFFDSRRQLMLALLLPLVERGHDSQVGYVSEAFVEMSGAAMFLRNPRLAAETEIRALQLAAEKMDAYHLWMLINSLRDLFRAARDEIIVGSNLVEYETRGSRLAEMIRGRDAAGIAKLVREEYEPGDRARLVELERRLLKQSAAAEAAGKAGPPRPWGPPAPIDAVDRCPTCGHGESDDVHVAEDGKKSPRCDPSSWYPSFIAWYQRNLNCNPWENPHEQPPGVNIGGDPAPGVEAEPYDPRKATPPTADPAPPADDPPAPLTPRSEPDPQ